VALQVGNYGKGTIKNYLSELRLLFHYHYEKDVGEITQKDIHDYIIFIKTAHGVGYAKCRSVAHACAFFYKKVIDRPYILPKTLYPRKQFVLPKVMSRGEVKRLFQANTDPMTRSILSLLYGSGLRIGEVKSLRLVDIKSEEKVLHISQSKGNKDRRTLLSEKQILELRAYWQSLRVKPKTYLYESPQSRSPYHERSLQLIVTTAMKRAGLENRGYTSHTLRHSFATHMLDRGVDIHTIKELLGHGDMRTTMIYLHLTESKRSMLVSPLDDIDDEAGATEFIS
jgi:integrase/recombinase XerD